MEKGIYMVIVADEKSPFGIFETIEKAKEVAKTLAMKKKCKTYVAKAIVSYDVVDIKETNLET